MHVMCKRDPAANERERLGDASVVLTSQNSSSGMLHCGQARLNLIRKTVPEFSRAVPVAQVGGVVAKGIAVLGGSVADSIEVRGRPG